MLQNKLRRMNTAHLLDDVGSLHMALYLMWKESVQFEYSFRL